MNEKAAVSKLQTAMAPSRVAFTWFGIKKALSRDQVSEAAEPFDTDGNLLSASKKLIDPSHPAFRAVTAIKHQVQGYWRDQSLPNTLAGAMTEISSKLDKIMVDKPARKIIRKNQQPTPEFDHCWESCMTRYILAMVCAAEPETGPSRTSLISLLLLHIASLNFSTS